MPTYPFVSRTRGRRYFLQSPPTPGALGKLTWAPAMAPGATVVNVPTGASLGALDTSTDYVLVMPGTALNRTLVIQGGRHVTVVGGRITNTDATAADGSQKHAGVYINGHTGVCHIEGLLLDGSGLYDGIVINGNKPGSIVQLQNIHIAEIHAGDEAGFTDIHPDNIQTISGPSKLRVDRFSGTAIYQGLFDYPEDVASNVPSQVEGRDLRNMDFRLRSDKTTWAGLPIYKSKGAGGDWPVTSQNCWVDMGLTSKFRMMFPGLNQMGRGWYYGQPGVAQGADGSGRFVPAASVGVGYVSPGYA